MALSISDKPFDSADFIFEIKFDGIRCIAYLDNKSTTLKSRNNNDITNIFPELATLHQKVNARCIIDGEIIIANKGRSDFNALLKRFSLSDEFKIALASKRNPVTFVAFDILYINNLQRRNNLCGTNNKSYKGNSAEAQNLNQLFNTSLMHRKDILTDTMVADKHFIKSAHIEKNGIAFFNKAKELGLEGIVAKRKDSLYTSGVRSNNWKKIKTMPHSQFRKKF